MENWKDSYVVRDKIRTDPKETMLIKRVAKKNKIIMREIEKRKGALDEDSR